MTRLSRTWMDLVPLMAGLWVAGLVLFAFAGRWDHPFDLEWMEGGMLAHAWRIQEWLPVYQEPDHDWIPYLYPPGYPAVLAGFGSIFGLSMGLGRLVSIAATLASCAALVGMGHRLKNVGLGLIAACIYLSCFPCTGGFYDLVRPDALGLAFFAWSVLLGLGGPRARLVSGLLLACAFTVKHNYAAYGLAMGVGIAMQHGWRQGARFVLASAVPALVFTVWLEVASGGHFLSTILGVAGAHPLVITRWFPGGIEEIGRHLAFVLVAVSIGFTMLMAQRGRAPVVLGTICAVLSLLIGLQIEGTKNMADPWWGAEWAAWLGLGLALGAVLGAARKADGRWVYGVGIAITAFATTGLMRAHHGGFLNVWMPLHWVLALSFLVVTAGVRARFSKPWEALMLLGALGHFVVRSDFEPERFRPQAEDLAAGMRFVELLEGCQGPVLSPYAPWLPVLAGHEPSWHLIALWDIAHRDGPYRSSVSAISRAAKAHHWDCVVVGTGRAVGYGIPAHYEVWKQPVPEPTPEGWLGPRPGFPKTGWRVRPKAILVPSAER